MSKETMSRVQLVIENTVLMAATAAGLMGGISRMAKSGQYSDFVGPNRFYWMVNPEIRNPNCFDAIIISTHSVTNGENVTLHVRSFVGDSTVEEADIDLSGRGVVLNRVDGMCLPLSNSASRGLIFSATNGAHEGELSINTIP